MGISEATFYRWKQLYGCLIPSEARKLRQLEEENARLRKVIADLTGQGDASGGGPPQTMTPARGCEMTDQVRTAFGVSIRKVCRAIPACRATYHYCSRRPEQASLRKRIREVAERKACKCGSNRRAGG